MLDIPEAVKNLCNSDSVRKNFRAVFDSGLVITNKDIVMDSLSFRESVFSGDSLTFGPAETSTLSFETVGVRNILGEWFKAWMELDASTLPEDLQTEKDDLDYPVYPIPLGRFVVTDCPRNHEAMAHRQITASSRLDSKESLLDSPMYTVIGQPFEAQRDATIEVAFTYDRLAEVFGFKNADGSFTSEWPISKNFSWQSASVDAYITIERDGITYALYADTNYDTTYRAVVFRGLELPLTLPQTSLFQSAPKQSLVSADFPIPDDVDTERIAEDAYSALREHGYRNYVFRNTTEGDIPATPELIRTAIKEAFPKDYFLPHLKVTISAPTGGAVYTMYEGSAPNIFPKCMPLPTSTKKAYEVFYQYTARYALYLMQNPIYAVSDEFLEEHPTLTASLRIGRPTIEAYQDYAFVLSTAITGEKMMHYQTEQFQYDVESMLELSAASLELSGSFGCFTRDGGEKYNKALSDEPVMRLTRSQYSSAWWDEYNLAPIGRIIYKIGETEYIYPFDEGESQYIFQNSAIFSRFKNMTPEGAQALMDEKLVPALRSLSFVPADIQARGLPYLEAGDCIELEAHDGTIIKTYVMERTMTGTQHLSDAIVADGITIAEVGMNANS